PLFRVPDYAEYLAPALKSCLISMHSSLWWGPSLGIIRSVKPEAFRRASSSSPIGLRCRQLVAHAWIVREHSRRWWAELRRGRIMPSKFGRKGIKSFRAAKPAQKLGWPTRARRFVGGRTYMEISGGRE